MYLPCLITLWQSQKKLSTFNEGTKFPLLRSSLQDACPPATIVDLVTLAPVGPFTVGPAFVAFVAPATAASLSALGLVVAAYFLVY